MQVKVVEMNTGDNSVQYKHTLCFEIEHHFNDGVLRHYLAHGKMLTLFYYLDLYQCSEVGMIFIFLENE